MDRRKMLLPEGWYPHSPASAEMQLKSWKSELYEESRDALSGIAPHAGWEFSGSLACKIISSIPRDCSLIIIAGGHLSASSACRVLDYDCLGTPFGDLDTHREMLNLLCSDFDKDRDADNTVEIMLPMVKYYLPHISVVAVRLPPSQKAADWGRLSSQKCKEKGIKAFFLGSTDLSHYGARFAYLDYGYGKTARAAVRIKDSEYLSLLSNHKIDESINHAVNNNTACSAGAASAAAAFALESGCTEGIIIDHRYSYDIYDSGADFVGYGSILYR